MAWYASQQWRWLYLHLHAWLTCGLEINQLEHENHSWLPCDLYLRPSGTLAQSPLHQNAIRRRRMFGTKKRHFCIAFSLIHIWIWIVFFHAEHQLLPKTKKMSTCLRVMLSAMASVWIRCSNWLDFDITAHVRWTWHLHGKWGLTCTKSFCLHGLGCAIFLTSVCATSLPVKEYPRNYISHQWAIIALHMSAVWSLWA